MPALLYSAVCRSPVPIPASPPSLPAWEIWGHVSGPGAKGQGHVRGVRARPMGRAGWGSNPCDRGSGPLIGRAAWLPASPASPLAPTPTLSRGPRRGRGRERVCPSIFEHLLTRVSEQESMATRLRRRHASAHQGRPARNGSRRQTSGGYGASRRGNGNQIGLFCLLDTLFRTRPAALGSL